MSKSNADCVHVNPWISQEFLLYRKDFKRGLGESRLIAKPFDSSLLNHYCALLVRAFGFQIPLPEADETRQYMREMSTQPYFNESFRAFWLDSELIGFYWCNGNLVDKIAVSPDYQGRGFGTYLLTHAFEHIFANSTCEYAHLMCMLQNKNGLKFYKGYGMLEGPIE